MLMSATLIWKFAIFVLMFAFAVSEDSEFEFLGNGFVINMTASTHGFHPSESNLTHGIYKWNIIPKVNDSKINLFFKELFLHKDDVVTVFKNLNDSDNDTNSIIEPITAQNGSRTIITDLPSLVVKLQGTDKTFQREFDAFYTSQACVFTIPPTLHIIHSPIYIGNDSHADCKYTYNHDPKHREIPVFLFDVFNFTTSVVTLKGTTLDGAYKYSPAVEFFPEKSLQSMSIDVDVNVQSKDYFHLLMHMVDSTCSEFIRMSDYYSHPIDSPNYSLDNGTFGSECRWVVKHDNSTSILGVAFTKLDFSSVMDIISINDGGSEISPPLLQVTTSNANHTMGQLVRSSGQYLWISFKPVHFISKMMANITVHGQGGHFKGEGEISMKSTVGNDTVFLLEVEENKVVFLNFTSSNFPFPATLSIYDGFDTKHLLTTLHGTVWYPILSKSSQMMIIATAFNAGSFNAAFSGISPGCLHMSSLSNENYILSGNCNNTCLWVIPPQDLPGSNLLLDLQYVSLEEEDKIAIYHLDSKKTLIGTVVANVTHVSQMALPASKGALVEVTRKQCQEESKIALIGHSSFVPACGGDILLNSSKAFRITSPLYPDTYPILAGCSWTLSASPKNSLIHVAFDRLTLAPNHCVRISNSETNKTVEFTGSQLPDDIFLGEGSSVHFNSSGCSASKTPLQLVSAEGFVLNGTVAECGAILEKSSGEFTVNVSSKDQSLCMWKVSVPSSNEGSPNIIAYTVTVKADNKNYELKVFDGASVRDSQIVNISISEILSRTNSLVFLYKRLNVSLPSSVFIIKYKTISCNTTMQCENMVCMHPDWRCNGINDCGDYSDEKNCDFNPLPPEIKTTGYSSVAFWLTFLGMLVLGILLGVFVPIVIQKYRNGQYHRFHDISVIE